MKWLKWSLAAVLVITAAVVFSAKLFQKKYTFYYYPEWNAYYDVQHKNYIYSIDGGKTWDTISNSLEAINNTLGEKIVLHSSSSEIWQENAEHRNKYGGALNDLVGDFLGNGEDKRKTKKKNAGNDSSYRNNNKEDLQRDSIAEMENWVEETIVQEKTIKAEETIQPKPDLSEEEKVPEVPETSDSTGTIN